MTHFSFVGTVFARISHTSPTNAATFVSKGFGGYTRHPIPEPRTQRLTGRNTGRFRWGCYLYPRTVLCGSETLRGRMAERCTLPLLGLGRMYSQRTQKAFVTAMRMMRVAVTRRRGPAGSRCSTAVSCAAPVSFAVRYHCDEGQRGKFVNVTVVILFVV